MDKKEIARETKKLKKNQRLQVTRAGRGYQAYLLRGNKQVKLPEGEQVLGVIEGSMTIAQVTEWLAEKEKKEKNETPVVKKETPAEKVKRIKALFKK